MKRFLIHAFATFGGTGYAPFAPATVASLVFALVWGAVSPVCPATQLLLLAGVVALGVPAAGWMERRHGPDPSLVVCDEVAGMLVTYLGVGTGWAGWLAGFFWFRFFDIAKPFPVRRAERLPGGWGITVDDLLAGVYANICLRLTLAVTGW
ncbi:phosphatidylglycerophosphatase A [bacterium]|nr:phosphatidylglycerophosphatase A [bacterium]MBU1675171.1 phosphatidylglycerophosphatase A [bacterium]